MFSEVFVGIAGQHIKSMKNRGYIIREAYEDEIKKEEVFRLIEGHCTKSILISGKR